MNLLRTALSILVVLTFHFAQAQYTETEGNDDFPNANDIVANSGATVTGVLGSGGDHFDYFRVTIPQYCNIKVSFSSTPGYSMLLGLYNGDTYGLAVMPSYVQTGADSVSFDCAVAGTYYVMIKDHPLNSTALPYTVEIHIENPLSPVNIDPEYNDEKDSAQWISFQPTIDPTFTQVNVQGNFRYRYEPGNPDTEDWYKFILTNPGATEIALATTYENYSIFLQSDHGSIAQNLFSNGRSACLEPDTFYVRVSTGTFGSCFSYAFSLRHYPRFNSTQENEPNNDIANADPFLENMYARIGHYSYDENGSESQDDRDYFQLITEEDGNLVIDIEPDSSSYAYSVNLSSSQSNNSLSTTITGNPAQGDTIQMRLNCAQADTFYLRIQTNSWCGNYHIRYQVETDSVGSGANEIEPNNSLEEAQDISSEPIIIASIDHRDNSNAPSYDWDEIDYYRITPTTEGDLRVVISSAPGEFVFPDIILMDSLGNQLAFEANDTLIYECVSRIPYYLSIHANQCNQYKLEWQVVSDFGTDAETNDVLAQANDFPIGTSTSSIEGRLGALQPTEFIDTYDYYKVMMSTSGNTKLWFTSEDGNGTLDIWSTAGDLRSSHQASVTDSVEIDLGCLAMDTFYISVSSTSCFGYRVSAQIETFLGTPDPEPNNSTQDAIEVTGNLSGFGTLGGEVISEASLGDTRDYYKLILEDHGTLSVNANTVLADNTPLIVQLLATDGATALRSDTLWNQGSVDYTYTCMQPDTLYLQVKPMVVGLECQVYTLSVQAGTSLAFSNPDEEPNDNEGSAIQLTNGQPVEGLVGFFRYGTADIDAADYYTFNASSAGLLGINFNSYETLDSVRVMVYSQSEPNLLQFDGNDLLPGGTYFQSFNVGFTEPIYVEVQNTQQCGHYELELYQDPTVDIAGIASSKIEVYPNPTNSIVTVSGVPVYLLQLVDAQGRLIQETSSSQMELTNIATGIYFLRISTVGSTLIHHRRLVKQ